MPKVWSWCGKGRQDFLRGKVVKMNQELTDSTGKCEIFYKIGDKVEAIKLNIGAWFNAVIIDIFPSPTCECYDKCNCSFKLLFESDDDNKAEIVERTLDEIRQVTYSSLEWSSLKKGMKVVINYNIQNPGQWGYWYDFIINNVSNRDGITYLKGTLLVGYNGVTDKIPVEINSEKVADVLEIRPHATVLEKEKVTYETGIKPEYCKSCKNKPKAKCRKCCCCKCGLKKDFHLTVLCEECADWYHIYCVEPPLTTIPDDEEDWYCPKCSNEVFYQRKEPGLKSKSRKRRKRGKQEKKEDRSDKEGDTIELISRKSETNVVAEKRPCNNFNVNVPEKRGRSVPTITSEIPKNSVIWNDIQKFFPRYEVLHITVELADKSGYEVDSGLSPTVERLIYGDEVNEHLWNEAKESLKDGKEAFLAHVKRLFTCSICCELMREPITLSCKHSFCITCFFKALSVNVYNCALCRTDVIHTQHYLVNENLSKALELLFEN